MLSILKREVKNYIKRPLFWIGIAIIVFMIFQNLSPYLNIHYLIEGESIVNDYPEMFRDGDVFEGYVPTQEGQRREMWEKHVCETLISEFQMDNTQAQAIINEMKKMDIMTACKYLEKYEFYGAYGTYVDTAYHKGTSDEINAYIAEKVQNKTFSYYFSRKFADFAGLFMGFFATVLLSVLFLQDTRKNTYELLHTKPVSAGKYLLGKVGGGFAVCLMTLAVLNIIFFALCFVLTRKSGFEVRPTDFILATCFYILPNMLMIINVYSLVSLIFKNPLPAVPLLFLYILYSNMGRRNSEGVYGYYGRPLAIMVRFPGPLFDTTPPPMVLLNQSFLIAILAASFCADTYTQEIASKRSEIQRLCPMKKRIYFIYRRIVIQEIFLLSVAAIGYGLFFLFQNPRTVEIGRNVAENEIIQFLIYFASIAITLGFWGILSNLLSCLFRNMWIGIGGCLILLLITNSSFGDRYLGAWNIFSYTFRNIENSNNFSWIYGKIVCICIGIVLVAILPKIIEKRG